MNKPRKYPKNAKRVYASPEFDVWEWPQKMFDGKIKIFRRAVQTDGVSVLATFKNKALLIKQQQPGTKWYYSFPGGALDHPHESPRKAALRELLEETGLKPKTIKLWDVVNFHGRIDRKQFIFLASDCEKVQEQSLDNGEKIEILTMPFEKLLKFTDHPQFHKSTLYFKLLEARVNKKIKDSLKQALFGKKSSKKR